MGSNGETRFVLLYLLLFFGGIAVAATAVVLMSWPFWMFMVLFVSWMIALQIWQERYRSHTVSRDEKDD